MAKMGVLLPVRASLMSRVLLNFEGPKNWRYGTGSG